MPNQEESRDGVPRKDKERPSADVERHAPDGQVGAGSGRADRQGMAPGAADRPDVEGGEPYESDGPGKMGLTSDRQPDLVSPSGVNERDHGAAEDKPMGGGSVNLDDDDMVRPRGKTTAAGGTRDAAGGDSAPIAPPHGTLSDRNGPSDPDRRKK
jgi:hypothetical protein